MSEDESKRTECAPVVRPPEGGDGGVGITVEKGDVTRADALRLRSFGGRVGNSTPTPAYGFDDAFPAGVDGGRRERKEGKRAVRVMDRLPLCFKMIFSYVELNS